MSRSLRLVLGALLLIFAGPAAAQVAQLDPWSLAISVNPPGGAINVNVPGITVSAGSQRLLVVAAILESGASGTVTYGTATFGGAALTQIASSSPATPGREAATLWYLADAQIGAGPQALILNGTHSENISGLHVYWASYSGVDQATPVNDSGANYAGDNVVTFGSVIGFVANGLTFYAAGNGGTPATHAPPATFTQRVLTTSDGHTSATADTAAHAAGGNYLAGTTVTFGNDTSNRSAVAVASLRPGPTTTTTIGNGLTAEPPSLSLCPGGGSADLDVFTLATSSGTDTITSVTVTLAPAGAFDNVASLAITNDAGTVTYGTATPASNTVAVALATNITATTTATQYRVRITPKTHAAMPAVPGASYATTGTVTAVGHTAGNGLVFNDTTSATLTIDNASPADPVWGTITPASGQITLNWTNPGGDFAEVVILRRVGAPVADAPVEGATYTAGTPVGTSTVAYVGSGTSFVDTGLTNGTSYFYEIFARDGCVNYSPGAPTGPHVPPAADLAVSKVAAATAVVGDDITYTITVTNNGPNAAPDATVSDLLPVDLTFVSATPSQGSCSGSTAVTCSLGAIASGGSASVVLVANAAYPGVISNTAAVSSSAADPNAANNSSTATVTVAQITTADVSVAVAAAPASVAIGANVTYTITVTNDGPELAHGVTLTDPLPAGMTWVSTVTSLGSCSGTLTVSCAFGDLPSGASAVVTVVATVDAGGTKRNTVTVSVDTTATYDANPLNDSASATTDVTGAAALVCSTPPVIGPAPGPLSGVINTYFPGTANEAEPGDTSIVLGAARALPGAQVPIAAGDLLLVIQMQDATINSTNTSNYGGGVGTGAGALVVNAGRYEFVRATNAVPLAGGTLTLQGAGPANGLAGDYRNANATATQGQIRFQVVRVPQYTTATLAGLTAAPWITNRTGTVGLGTGGIAAVDVQGSLTVSAGVAASVDGVGFRGAAGRRLTGGAGNNTDWRTLSTINTNGGKGEGNAGTPMWVYDPAGSHACGGAIGAPPDYFINTNQPSDGYPNGSMARGAPGNAGGGSTDGNPGANDENSGGGGGSNGGRGGTGGNSWLSNLANGGVGAAVVPALSQLVLGGGGGAGTRNNDNCGSNGATAAQEGQASSGAAGGGLLVVRAAALDVAAGAIFSADGSSAFDDTLNDGGGGGGAGGSAIVMVTTGTLGGLTVRARGGKGGSAWALVSGAAFPGNRHGPGGGGGGGVVAYVNTAAPPVLDVSAGQPGITTLANDPFGAQPGDPGQTLFAAPGLIPGVGSASECAYDLAIALGHSPATGSTGSTVTFQADVTNVAPFNSTSGLVSVTIAIDPGLAFSGGASGSGWTCAPPVLQSVTCTRSDALAAQFAYPPITFNATIVAGGAGTLSNNVATVGNAGDANASNDTDTDVVGVRAPTFAQVRSFQATRARGLVLLRWQTSFEARNLGFRVYREAGGERQPITPSLVAGSALFVGRPHLSSGRSYAWVDRAPGPDPTYWLEDVDLSGARTWTGPIAPEDDALPGGEELRESPLLTALGRVVSPRGEMGTASGIGTERRVAPATREAQDWSLPSRPAAKLAVRQEGFYRLTKAELLAAGYDPGTDPAALQLVTQGRPQGLLVHDGGDGRFDAADWVEFYGLALDSPFDPDHVYWLASTGGRTGRRPQAPDLAAAPLSPRSFPFTVERRDRTVYFAALTNNGDTENFFGAVITSEPTPLGLLVSNLDPTARAEARLTLVLQGATPDVVHDVAVRLNGQDLGRVAFTGQAHSVQHLAVPASLLLEGVNELALTALGGAEDVSVVDTIQLTYQHLYRLDDGALRLLAPGGGTVTIEGLGDQDLRVVDVSDAAHLQELPVQFDGPPGDLSATVAVPPGPTRTLFAFRPARVLQPASVVLNAPSDLRAPQNGADLVIVAHASLRGALQPLQALRAAQGLATVLVDAADVYDEFGFGQKTPYALRDLLRHASSAWARAPRFVLLAGDASFDPKNYLGLGDYDLLPTKLIPTAFLKTDSDDWFADFDQDGLPELAVGRLPARSADEAALLVAKLQAQAASLPARPGDPAEDWRQRALVVSDRKAEVNFDASAAGLVSLLPPGLAVQRISVTELGAGTPAALRDALGAGQLLVDYVGHGSEDLWSRDAILTSGDAYALTNGTRLPFVVDMTCLNGLFADLYVESLAEAFLKAPAGGAVAVWASSGLSEPEPQVLMNRELLRRLFRPQASPLTVGEAVALAKAAVADQDVRRTFILFGDPSMRLR